MPKDLRHPSPVDVRLRLVQAARAGLDDDATRRLIDDVVDAVGRAAAHGRDPGAVERVRADAAALAREAAQGASAALRLTSADRLADAYAALYQAALSRPAGPAVAGKNAVFPLAPAGRGNLSLAGAFGLWAAGGRIIEPTIDIEIPGAPPRPCVPAVVRVTVEKPGILPEIGDAGLEPDFLHYLRETDQFELRSFAAWRASEGLAGAPTDAERAAYEVALAQAYRAYEEWRFTDRYCRPQDLAAPGEQHGHRLLRMPLRLGEADFLDTGCGSRIYEGELAPPLPPELDYGELVRRYVNLLKPESGWRADVNAVTRGDIVEAHLRDLGNADLPAVLQLMVVATQTALQQRSMASFIDVYDDLSRRGLRFTDWLMGPEATDVRDAITAAWNVIVGAGASGGAPSGSAANALSPTEFNRALTGICVALPNPPADTSRIPGMEPGKFLWTNAPRPPAEVRDEVARVVGLFDAVWTEAAQLLGPEGLRNVAAISLSGLEARSHIALLTVAALASGVYPYDRLPAPQGVAQEILNWLAQSSVPIRYDDVVGALPDGPGVLPVGNEQFQRKEFWHDVQQPQVHRELVDPAYDAIARVTDSYAAALDAVLSLSSATGLPAGTTAAAAVNPYGVRPSDLPALLQRWTTLFEAFLLAQRKRRQVVDDPLLVLRLVPRRGRYGETPQRTAGEELKPEPKETAWPGHPTRTTEGYVLEPLPRRYFMRYFPALYIREDYRIALRPRGYGIGANLYSMSLLPEEEQTIVVKSFKDTRTKVSESTAENVFEEAGSETSNDFANEMARENQQESSNESDFNVNAKASASFLYGSAELSTGYSAKDSAREFAKNTSNVTSKLAQKLSSKRTVAVETKREGEREEGTHAEISTERKVRNPNMGHTVTFHWFQMTRKFLQELTLEDVKLVYTSGKHNVLCILADGELPVEIAGLPAAQAAALPIILNRLPPDVAQRLPPNAAVVIVGEPYTEAIGMSGANAFLARVFIRARAVELNSLVWQHLGYFDAAPNGLGIAAYCGNRRADPGADRFVPLFNPNPQQLGDAANPGHVVADRILVRREGAPADDGFFLPNLDLRHRVHDGVPPSRYSAPAYDQYAVPRLMATEERIVNTNGVFCEAMVGRCTALEDYLQRHRDLDLLEKRIHVGLQEIEFRWSAAKDGLQLVEDQQDRAITAVVGEIQAGQGFVDRLAVERERQAEQRAIAADRMERRKLVAEAELLESRVQELKRRIELLGTPSEVKIDAPQGATVAVNADVSLGSKHDENPGGTVTIE